MKTIVIPQQDVNSQSAFIREWHVADRERVEKNQVVATVETSKAAYDITSPDSGIIIFVASLDEEVSFNIPIALISPNIDQCDSLLSEYRSQDHQVDLDDTTNATKKAKQLAKELGVNLTEINKKGIIRESDVIALANSSQAASSGRASGFLSYDEYPKGLPKILVIGAGNALAQIVDIVYRSSTQRIVGCVDDDLAFKGKQPYEIPYLGTCNDVLPLFKDGVFDHLVVGISSSVKARRDLFNRFREKGIPFANIIDPSSQINRYTHLGQGNVICSHVHIGSYTSLGDNNFISAKCSIDHHNIWGSNNTLGPGCCFSGSVRIASNIKFGTGIFVQNRLEIGDNCIIASGAILTHSVPADHVVKVELNHKTLPLKSN